MHAFFKVAVEQLVSKKYPSTTIKSPDILLVAWLVFPSFAPPSTRHRSLNSGICRRIAELKAAIMEKKQKLQ